MTTNPPILQLMPLRRPKLHELVVQRFEEMIRKGEVKPGDPLPSEREIMAAFNIGRPAVREALLSLENRGLVTTENGRRAHVRLPNVDNVFATLNSIVGIIIDNGESLKNLFDARVVIEVAMARNAATKILNEQLQELEAALHANKQAIGNRSKFVATDIDFHRILFLVSGNPVFEALHKALVQWLTERWRSIERDDSTETLAYHGHLQIYKAIAHRDPDAAEKAMRKHLSSSWTVWRRQLESTRT